MKLVVISPEQDHPRELAVVERLFLAGLERFHVRKPAWSREQFAGWLRQLPTRWRARLVLHQHHDLVAELDLGGVHYRDEPSRENSASASDASSSTQEASAQRAGQGAEDRRNAPPRLISRSCHDLAALRASLGHFDSVFFSPVFPSLSKPGYAPREEATRAEVAALLAARTTAERRTSVLALGGITTERIAAVRALGFDGVAVLGAVWQSTDPERAFTELQDALCCHAA